MNQNIKRTFGAAAITATSLATLLLGAGSAAAGEPGNTTDANGTATHQDGTRITSLLPSGTRITSVTPDDRTW